MLSSVHPKFSDMNDEDIRQFLQSFSDFMKHSETEIQRHEEYLKAKEYTNNLLEKKAAELEVTVDYYMQEFMWNEKQRTNHPSPNANW